MATLLSKQITDKVPVPSANAATDVIPLVGDYTLTAAAATGDELEMVVLPAGYVVVDVIVDTEDCGTAVTADVGIMSGTPGTTGTRTCGAEFMSAKALGTAGIYRMDVSGGGRVAPTTADRGIGFALTTVTTPTAGAKIRMTVLARPQSEGV
jgi:hypothetical protein